MKEASPELSPDEIRSIMQNTARDVTDGASHPNTPGTTGSGPDTATGHGLADAHRAGLSAKLNGVLAQVSHPVDAGSPLLTADDVAYFDRLLATSGDRRVR